VPGKGRLVVLSGGTGSSKLVRGLSKNERFVVVANVGDNAWFHGLYVCPDIDTVTYTLAGIADASRGWGIREDRFEALGQLKTLGSAETWFKLGDRDLATHIMRTALLKEGRSLTEVTSRIARRLGVRGIDVLPATDRHVETHIVTSEGEMHLQEFWVRDGGRPSVKRVVYVGADKASPTPRVERAVASAERIIISPANPITSIMPILSIRGFRGLLRESEARKVAVSPFIGERAFSGPAAGLMASQKLEPTSEGVAGLYKGLIDAIVIDESDARQKKAIEGMGISCVLSSTLMKSPDDERRVAKVAIEA